MKMAIRWLAALLLAISLASCGGGGDGGDNCAGGSVAASFGYAAPISVNVGTPISTTPTVTGVPASCVGSMHFELDSGTIPPGVSLDRATGTIAGTPTATGSYAVGVRMGIQNLSGTLSSGIRINIFDSASYSFSGWESMIPEAPFLDNFRIGVIGSTLYVVSRNGYTALMETWQSTDGGATWTNLPITNPTGNLQDFALASDGTSIWLTGGVDAGTRTSSNQVWRFDGTAWTQVATTAPFTARSAHAMVAQGGALYVMGGRIGNTMLGDTWKSTDGGVTWTQTATSGFGPRDLFCAVSDGTQIFVMGGENQDTQPSVYRSTDGAAWSSLALPSTSPFLLVASNFVTGTAHSGACAWLNGRIVYSGGIGFAGSGVVSSPDGINWQFEPGTGSHGDYSSPGGVAMGGRMYFVMGEGTSERLVLRTVP